MSAGLNDVANIRPQLDHRPFSDPSRLAPEDAFFAHSPPRRQRDVSLNGVIDTAALKERSGSSREGVSARRRREKERGRSGSRRRKGTWKKLLWVKQNCMSCRSQNIHSVSGHVDFNCSKDPDNYTDPPTFLSHLQRNPRLLPYDFWPLVADSTVIVQHVCSVAIFVCCFAGIIQEEISPVSVVSWGSAGTVLGWVFWDFWVGQEEAARSLYETIYTRQNGDAGLGDDGSSIGSTLSTANPGAHSQPQGLGLSLGTNGNSTRNHSRNHSRNLSASSLHTVSSAGSPIATANASGVPHNANYNFHTPYTAAASQFSPRNQQRLATVKSAILIYCALLGLSPILKSLTKSTTSDSIWAMSCWLMSINVFFFDYGGGVGVKFPASLSTNAALMASTVLASRLPSTTHVFSLTLFSIEVFGLFPVFRRHLRHRSWRLHITLTILLIAGAGAGLGAVLIGQGIRNVILGVGIWGIGTVLAMGGCSWWLIGLQKYKNVVIGPWDPARPIIRGGGWD
ncbi:hypothetical protein MMC26_005256 [Xylographa opegraphella]|nr:hypothetical protein [Xylographa opegraphella]